MYKTLIALAGLLPALAMAAPVPPADGGDYELIADPAELSSRGFDPDGPVLWRLKPGQDPQDRAEREAQREAERVGSPVFGGPAVRWAAVQGVEFKFVQESALYDTRGDFTQSCTEGSPNRFADAPVKLKDDRRLTWLDVWTYDTSSTEGVTVGLYRSCQPAYEGGAPVVTELALIQGGAFSDGYRFQDFLMSPTYVQNSTCAYWVRAMFSSCDAGLDVRVQKARVSWSQAN